MPIDIFGCGAVRGMQCLVQCLAQWHICQVGLSLWVLFPMFSSLLDGAGYKTVGGIMGFDLC